MADFEKIFEENQSFVFRFLLKMCRDSHLAEELTQETFFKAYMNAGQLKNEEKASVWLCSIAKNTYFAYAKEQNKLTVLEETENLAQDDGVDTFFEDKELSTKAFEALHSLEEPYKEVFMLSVFGELSLKEISRLFGKSESWARVTFYRARQKLAERLIIDEL